MADESSHKMHFPIDDVADVVKARRRGLEIALGMGFSRAEATKIAVVISELGRNIENYAAGGSITVTMHDGDDKHIMIVAKDQGPGIPDVDRVLQGGYSTSLGLGSGISGSRRLMDQFEVRSVGGGTTIKACKWLR